MVVAQDAAFTAALEGFEKAANQFAVARMTTALSAFDHVIAGE